MSERPLSEYTQLGKDNTNAYQPSDDDDKQRIDLDEFYETCEQTGVTAMVNGAEAYFSHGVLSKATARLCGIKGCENFDPVPSRFNARLGGESFVTEIVDGFKKFIENIIKYIKMAVNWLIDIVKTLFGYKKTHRQVDQAAKEMENIKKEFNELLKGLGFPAGTWDLENFIGNPDMSFDRLSAFKILRSKFVDDEEAIKRLGESLPTFITTLGYMNDASKKMRRASDNFHRTIQNAAHQVQKQKTGGMPELELIKVAANEIKLATNFDEVAGKLSELLTSLYMTKDKENKFSSEALQEGFMAIKAQLAGLVHVSVVSMKSVPDKATLLSKVAEASVRYEQLRETDIDISTIDFKLYSNIISQEDSKIIMDLDHLTNCGGALIASYNSTAKLVRDYTQFCHSIMTELNKVYKQLESLWLWHTRSQQMIYFYVLKDLETITELNKQYMAAGMNPYANGEGIPRVDAFINYDDRVTLFEKIAGTANDLLEANINGIMDSIKEAGRNMGWTPS